MPDYPRIPIDRSQTRSMVISTRGVVSSEHPLASQAGAAVLASGGHAVDAAIAANSVMGVVSPMMCGAGGDLFAIVSEADGTLHGLNASGWAPAASSPALLRSKDITSMPQSGPLSVTVPGAVAGWCVLHQKFGRLPLNAVLSSAIALADEGFPVAEIGAAEWSNAEPFLKNDPEAARVFLPRGRPLRVGEVFRNSDLAASYRTIAREGIDAMYGGELGRAIVKGLVKRGGVTTLDDFAEFRPEWASPITTTYREWEIFEMPPNGSGIAALLMLNILENFPLSRMGHNSVESLHTLIEAKKLAYADMQKYIGDPAVVPTATEPLLRKDYARDRARLIDPQHASAFPGAGVLPQFAGDTIYLTVVDRAGNMVSLIQSNFASFGSGIVAEGTGFALQNRGGLFTLDTGHPNELMPRKRPLHTIIPGFMRRGRVRIAFGIMGGWNQSQAHAQFVSNVVDHGLNIQAALEAPRVTKLTFEGRDVTVEARLPPDVRAGLSARGHEVIIQGEFSSQVGGGQAAMRDDEMGVNFGASDPRKDGEAIPEL